MSQSASLETDVLVVGAGPAGLTASCLLTKALRDVIVLERDPRQVGGIARTTDYKGFLIDRGGHRFTSRSRAIEQFWRDLAPNDFVETPLATRTWREGLLQPHPRTAVEALRTLGAGGAAAGLMSLAHAKLHPIAAPKSLHDWGRNAFGDRLFDTIFRTPIEKAFGSSSAEIPAARARDTIDDLELGSPFWSALASLAGRTSPGEATFRPQTGVMRYPRRGSGMVWSAAARRTVEQGGRLLTGHRLDALSFDPATGLWLAGASTADGAWRTIAARTVIASGPIPELCGALRPTPISLFSARALRHRALVSVALVAARRPSFEDHWIDVCDPGIRALRVRNFGALSPEMIPHPDLGCIGVEYVCEEGDDLWSMADEQLVALARREVARMGLLSPRHVIDACVLREARACPIIDEDTEHHLTMVRLDLEKAYPTLHLVGRNGTHGGHRQEHAMMSAMLTVENILAGDRIHDVWNPAREEARWGDPASGPARARHAA